MIMQIEKIFISLISISKFKFFDIIDRKSWQNDAIFDSLAIQVDS